MANKILSNLNLDNNDYRVVHGVKINGLNKQVLAKPEDQGVLDLSPLVPTINNSAKGKSLTVNSEGTALIWAEGGKVDDVKTGTVSRVTNKIAELPSMSKGTGANAIVLGSVNAANSDSRASGANAVAEGSGTTASGANSHAEGFNSTASGLYGAHAEGYSTQALGGASHAEGNHTIASQNSQHVQGKYNVEDSEGLFADIVGWGTNTSRKNISSLTTEGDLHLKGDVYIQSDSEGKNGIKLVPTVSEGVAGYVLAVNSEGKQLEWAKTNLLLLFGEDKDSKNQIIDYYNIPFLKTEIVPDLNPGIAALQTLLNLNWASPYYGWDPYNYIPDTNGPDGICTPWRVEIHKKYQFPGEDGIYQEEAIPSQINVDLDGVTYQLQENTGCTMGGGWAAADASFDWSDYADGDVYLTSWGSAPVMLTGGPAEWFSMVGDTDFTNYWDPDGDNYYNYMVVWTDPNVIDPAASHTIKIYV